MRVRYLLVIGAALTGGIWFACGGDDTTPGGNAGTGGTTATAGSGGAGTTSTGGTGGGGTTSTGGAGTGGTTTGDGGPMTCTSACDCENNAACLNGTCSTDYTMYCCSSTLCTGAPGKVCQDATGKYDVCRDADGGKGEAGPGPVDPCTAFDCASGAVCPPSICKCGTNDSCVKL